MSQMLQYTRYIFIFYMLLLLSGELSGQYEDWKWIAGYEFYPYDPHPEVGYLLFTFNRDNTVEIDTGNFHVRLGASTASISSDRGIEVFTNGCRVISGEDYETIENGDAITGPSQIYDSYCPVKESGGGDNYIGFQNMIMLPHPLDDTKTGLFYYGYFTHMFPYYPTDLVYSEISYDAVARTHAVVRKAEVIESNTLEEERYGSGLTATRHGNGRDWWIFLPISRGENPRFHVYLWDGLEMRLQEVHYLDGQGLNGISVFTQVSISAQGDKITALNPYDMKRIYVLDFDRCSGILYNEQIIGIDSTDGGGVVFSHSGRYLYQADVYNYVLEDGSYLYQYDLEAADIEGSREIIGELDFTLAQDWEMYDNFFQLQRAPDGRIFIGGTVGQKHYHVIQYPELKGVESGYLQYGVRFPKYRGSGGLTIFPNYHVTAMPGTVCDSLGMGRSPYTKWNYRVDGERVRFFDLSYYGPDVWAWDFGDGNSGSGHQPEHAYSRPGVYVVCLKAGNAYGDDEFCMEIEVDGSTGIYGEGEVRKLQVYPNPVAEELYIREELLGSRYELMNLSGQVVGHGILVTPRLDVRGLTGGVYVLRVLTAEGEVYVGKLVKGL